MLISSKEHTFELIIDNANRCNLCSRMQGRTRVLSKHNGNIYSKIVFIGEAPGRLGADKTGIPFLGDVTGRNFERLLINAGLSRNDIFITNALLCNPRDNIGNNSTPKKNELVNCSIHLNMILDLIQPSYIVTLGLKALLSLNILEPHNFKLATDVGKLCKWRDCSLIPMYHPGPRAAIRRSYASQISDFLFLSKILGTSGSKNKLI